MIDDRWLRVPSSQQLRLINGILLGLVAIAIVGVEVVHRPAASLEGSVRRYAVAISNSDLDAAMAEIAPDQRVQWTDWVRGQLGNVYDVTGVAVHVPAITARPTDVTVVLDINRGYPDEFYQPTATVPAEEFGGRWYLAAPLLSP